MPTHALGHGTANLSVNLPEGEKRDVGRLATMHGARSVGAYVRDLLEREVHAARVKGLLDTSGQTVLRIGRTALVVAGMVLVGVSSIVGSGEMRRAARRTPSTPLVRLVRASRDGFWA